MKAVAKLRKYQLPEFLSGVVEQFAYDRWLARKAAGHVKRDRRRGNAVAMIESYKVAIHKAVGLCGGIDDYTGEKLRWDLIGKYSNVESQSGRRAYRATLSLLPTVDHVGDGLGAASFRICGLRTNDAKSDFGDDEFIEFCQRVIAHWASKKR
jgi:hypothetical protein